MTVRNACVLALLCFLSSFRLIHCAVEVKSSEDFYRAVCSTNETLLTITNSFTIYAEPQDLTASIPCVVERNVTMLGNFPDGSYPWIGQCVRTLFSWSLGGGETEPCRCQLSRNQWYFVSLLLECICWWLVVRGHQVCLLFPCRWHACMLYCSRCRAKSSAWWMVIAHWMLCPQISTSSSKWLSCHMAGALCFICADFWFLKQEQDLD